MAKLKTIDFDSIKDIKKKNESEFVEKQNKVVLKNKQNRELLKTFSKMYKELTENEFKFYKARYINYGESGKNSSKFIPSDIKRLNSVFNIIQGITKDLTISAHVICKMIKNWSEWDKAQSRNLIGFMERQCSEELEVMVMKLKKTLKGNEENKMSMMTKHKHKENIDKHREYFAKSA